MPQKAFRDTRTKRPKSHIEILPHPWNSFLASKFPSPSQTWNHVVLCSFHKHVSSSGADLPHPRNCPPNGSRNFVDLSFAISQVYSFHAAVTSQSHHHPQTTATMNCLTLKYNGSHRTRLPPSYWDTTSHLAHRIQPFQCEMRCNVTARTRAAVLSGRSSSSPSLFQTGNSQRLITLRSRTVHGERLTHLDCRPQQNLNWASLSLCDAYLCPDLLQDTQ